MYLNDQKYENEKHHNKNFIDIYHTEHNHVYQRLKSK